MELVSAKHLTDAIVGPGTSRLKFSAVPIYTKSSTSHTPRGSDLDLRNNRAGTQVIDPSLRVRAWQLLSVVSAAPCVLSGT